ncbi:ABC transporter ATP-binding protein [Murimonas intestini]|uniref:Peptide/nickel transport system ATP-binding protein n=1 Tax=Murimonas intestini TaxID=1337051 RepID=A0AB73T2R9_9FIRM|nr:ABC transporter ATP-binding protein [Murimonas intestini]MCR1841675.1 ABC transporter ATP-binding protein [Murimonas intestini]MCR1865492.1 ABC transporter ATP-binding protein [Murimonas intestini]MCR1883927.1 ABC transporter ATP-binding protein [Murimonas intestini]
MLKLTNVCAQYETGHDVVRAVDHVNLEIRENEIMGIAGESGCGKSTLMKLMYGLIEYPLSLTDGSIELKVAEGGGRHGTFLNEDIQKQWWKGISYVPQGAMHVMNPVSKIKSQFFDAVCDKSKDKKQLEKEIAEYLNELELPREVLSAYPHQLSGGMRQRVLIALATFLNPEIVFADEPTTALDVVVQRGILNMLSRVHKKTKNSMVMVSHDMGVHYQITDRLCIMYAGQVLEVGPTMKIFENPRHPYTQMLIHALPRIGDNSQKEGIKGAPPSLKNPPAGCRFSPRCPHCADECRKKRPTETWLDDGHMASCHLLTGKRRESFAEMEGK